MMIIEQLKERFHNIVKEYELMGSDIAVKMRPLTPHEAIGYPTRDDYPLLKGKEVLIEATFRNYKGQAFTDEPSNFIGNISNVIDLELDSNRNRAIFISTLNAVLRFLRITKNTIHCRNEEPEECSIEIAERLFKKYGKNLTIGMLGLQPAIAEKLIKYFSPNNVRVADLDINNMGKNFNGIIIEDGSTCQNDIISKSSVILATGSSVVNGTIDKIIETSKHNNKTVIFFGVTIAGAAELLGLNRLCFMAHEE